MTPPLLRDNAVNEHGKPPRMYHHLIGRHKVIKLTSHPQVMPFPIGGNPLLQGPESLPLRVLKPVGNQTRIPVVGNDKSDVSSEE